jgi:hypothetical protein
LKSDHDNQHETSGGPAPKPANARTIVAALLAAALGLLVFSLGFNALTASSAAAEPKTFETSGPNGTVRVEGACAYIEAGDRRVVAGEGCDGGGTRPNEGAPDPSDDRPDARPDDEAPEDDQSPTAEDAAPEAPAPAANEQTASAGPPEAQYSAGEDPDAPLMMTTTPEERLGETTSPGEATTSPSSGVTQEDPEETLRNLLAECAVLKERGERAEGDAAREDDRSTDSGELTAEKCEVLLAALVDSEPIDPNDRGDEPRKDPQYVPTASGAPDHGPGEGPESTETASPRADDQYGSTEAASPREEDADTDDNQYDKTAPAASPEDDEDAQYGSTTGQNTQGAAPEQPTGSTTTPGADDELPSYTLPSTTPETSAPSTGSYAPDREVEAATPGSESTTPAYGVEPIVASPDGVQDTSGIPDQVVLPTATDGQGQTSHVLPHTGGERPEAEREVDRTGILAVAGPIGLLVAALLAGHAAPRPRAKG